MTKLLLFSLILFSLYATAQVGKIKVKKETEKKEKPAEDPHAHHGSFDLYYGNRIYTQSYYNQLNTISNMKSGNPHTFIGIGLSGYKYTISRSINVLGQINYYKIIPVRINIEDSLSTKLSGYVFGLGFGTAIATRSKNLSLAAYLGFNTGRTTLSKNEFITQKNPFFSPKITLQPKFIFKRIAISIMLEAEYDVSNPAWRQTIFERKDLYLLKPFHQTCYTGLISLGYRIG